MMPQPGGLDTNLLAQRLRRLVSLDATVFDEVRTDANATMPASLVVGTASLLMGLGGWLWWFFGDYSSKGEFFVKSAIGGAVVSSAMWFVWVSITYVLLAQVFRARADLRQLIRVMGFATAPLGLSFLMCIHSLDFGIAVAVLALFFGTEQIAVQSATDADSGRVLVANGAGFALWAIILNLFAFSSSTWTPGVFIFAPR